MKKALLTITALLVTVLSFAKIADEDNPKYGKGAVPEDENGNVYFSQSVHAYFLPSKRPTLPNNCSIKVKL